MELVKRLNFEDISVTVRTSTLERSATPDGNGAMEIVELQEDCSVAEFRQEAQRIRQNLLSVREFVNDFCHPFQEKVKAEAEAEEHSVRYLKTLISMLKAESEGLTVKEGVLKRLSDWKIGDEEKDDEDWLENQSAADTETIGESLTALKTATAETISEIESLIRTLATDVTGLESDLGNATEILESFDMEVEKLEEGVVGVVPDNEPSGQLAVSQRGIPEDLETTIRQLEESLKQNEKEYMEADAAMETRIAQYSREIEELKAQATELDKEEECVRRHIDVTGRFLESLRQMDISNGVSVVSVENGTMELRLTIHEPVVCDYDVRTVNSWEHELRVTLNPETAELENAQLTPTSVDIDDLLSAAKEKSKFGEVAFLVRAIHQRLSAHLWKL